MFSLQSGIIAARLRDAGLNESAIDALMEGIGNCSQRLAHRGPIDLETTLKPGATEGAINVSGFGNFPYGAVPTSFVNGAVAPGGLQANQNGPFAILVKHGVARFNGPVFLNGVVGLGDNAKIDAITSALVAGSSCWLGADSNGSIYEKQPDNATAANCSTHRKMFDAAGIHGIGTDDTGRIIGYFDHLDVWHSAWSVAEPT